MTHTIIILGSGPAGLTAGIYNGRAGLKPLIIAGKELGGLLSWATDIENYPGFPDAIMGMELVDKMRVQAEKWGATIVYDVATAVDLSKRPFVITTPGGIYKTKALIVTVGASPLKLNVPGEKEFTGRGVSYCGTCDGPFFRGKEVFVVGGGDAALGEALFLRKFCSKVTLVCRRSEFRASLVMRERISKEEGKGLVVKHNTTICEIGGEDKVSWVTLKDTGTGKKEKVTTSGVFIFAGQVPNTELFKGQLVMDDKGYIKVDERKRTSVPGVFAGGQSEDRYFKQVVTATGDGCKAALEAERWLESQIKD